jgi:NTP pyrophosphatase (non-canonical NTP hydrolase)
MKVDTKAALDLLQDECRKTAIYPKQQGLAYTALGLVGESGEYAEKIKKYIRDGKIDDQLAAKELFDVIWYVSMCAHELGYDLSEVVEMGLEKLRSRQERGVIGGSGDTR